MSEPQRVKDGEVWGNTKDKKFLVYENGEWTEDPKTPLCIYTLSVARTDPKALALLERYSRP